MDLTQWDQRFATGYALVDQQHQHLFAMVGELQRAIVSKHGTQRVLPTLLQLASYVGEHFATEEQMMQERGYPNLDRHRGCHMDLTARTSAIIADFRHGQHELSAALSDFLSDWIRQHIFQEDMEMIQWIQGRNAASGLETHGAQAADRIDKV